MEQGVLFVDKNDSMYVYGVFIIKGEYKHNEIQQIIDKTFSDVGDIIGVEKEIIKRIKKKYKGLEIKYVDCNGHFDR